MRVGRLELRKAFFGFVEGDEMGEDPIKKMFIVILGVTFFILSLSVILFMRISDVY
jgi:hypothetical protein